MSAELDIHAQCAGRWAAVLVSLGYERKLFTGKHQACPICGGKDRFRWHPVKEVGFCNHCNSLQPMDMALEITGESFKLTAARIRGERLETLQVVQKEDKTAENEARIKKIHAGLRRMKGDCPASKYLANRGLRVLPDADCYYHPGVDHWSKDKVKSTHPAMVSLIRTPQGEVASIHVTYLTYDGQKANVEPQKKVFPVIKSIAGGAIRLFPSDSRLAIAEGVETALAVNDNEGLPCWAAGNANQVEKFECPAEVTELWIYSDMETSFAGLKAASALANRMSLKGVVVYLNLVVPDGTGFKYLTLTGEKLDFLDWHVLSQSQEGHSTALQPRHQKQSNGSTK